MSEHIIKIDNSNIFQGEALVLSNVSLTVDKGEFVYLVGKTGSGKSSLLKTLYADIDLVEGTAEVVGYQLKGIKDKDIPYLRRKIGVIFQDFQLLTDRDIFGNLVFVLKATGWKDKSAMETRVKEVLAKVGMKTKGHKMPFQLSGGEQQRIAIARALLNDPELIIADEPTGNLDPKTSEEIIELLIGANEQLKTTVIVVTHNIPQNLNVDYRHFHIEYGSIHEVN